MLPKCRGNKRMEAALAAVGRHWARQDRKRRRDAAVQRDATGMDAASAASAASTASAVSTASAASAARQVLQPAMHPALLTEAVQKRLHESVRALIDEGNDRKIKAGSAFIARSVYAVFIAVQTIHPLPYGPQWAGLLHICYHIVCVEFSGLAHSLRQPNTTPPEGLTIREMRALIRKLGMLPNGGGDDEALMKAARTWERASDSELSHAVAEVWTVLSDVPRVSIAVTSLLWPCQRAHLLFDQTNNIR